MQRPTDYRDLLIRFDSIVNNLKQDVRKKIEQIDDSNEENKEVAKVHATHKLIVAWFNRRGNVKKPRLA